MIWSEQYWISKTVETWISVNQERRNFGYDKAEMAHETSPKSSVSEFLGGLVSFPDFMIFIPVKDRFDPCPLCNAFSHIYQELIRVFCFSEKREILAVSRRDIATIWNKYFTSGLSTVWHYQNIRFTLFPTSCGDGRSRKRNLVVQNSLKNSANVLSIQHSHHDSHSNQYNHPVQPRIRNQLVQ